MIPIGDMSRYLPISTTIGLVRAPLKVVDPVERHRHRRWAKMWKNEVRFRRLQGSVEAFLRELLPLVPGVSTRDVYVEAGRWTALFNNQRYGSDPAHISLLAEELGVEAIRVTVSRGQFPGERKHRNAEGWGFSYWNKGAEVRSVMVSNEFGRWKLYDIGPRLKWEEPLSGSPRDAFSLEVFGRYLDRFELRPWNSAFYGAEALLVERDFGAETVQFGVDSQALPEDLSNLAWNVLDKVPR
ncbi:MAG: hypothetical protein AMXMBFR34_50150 [Myxococcaceae bacterium]